MAACPVCGRKYETARIQPLFLVTGASGAGKTTIFAPLARMLEGTCIVFDVDWLLDAAGELSGAGSVAEIPWGSFRHAWLSVAHGVAQSGLPTLLLGPLIPEHLEVLPARKWAGQIHALVLDCSDELRSERIEARCES